MIRYMNLFLLLCNKYMQKIWIFSYIIKLTGLNPTTKIPEIMAGDIHELNFSITAVMH